MLFRRSVTGVHAFYPFGAKGRTFVFVGALVAIGRLIEGNALAIRAGASHVVIRGIAVGRQVRAEAFLAEDGMPIVFCPSPIGVVEGRGFALHILFAGLTPLQDELADGVLLFA